MKAPSEEQQLALRLWEMLNLFRVIEAAEGRPIDDAVLLMDALLRICAQIVCDAPEARRRVLMEAGIEHFASHCGFWAHLLHAPEDPPPEPGKKGSLH